MPIIRKLACLGVAAAALYAAPANAQATRTWVSGVGDDANPCSRTAPCKTFAGAVSKTAAGGEINCLDPGGFGAVTITKSMTINCVYTEGGVLAGGNGITVNDSATSTPGTIVVYLRGLDIFGVNPPSHGVRFVSGAALHIENSTIRRFNGTNSFGISFQPSGAATLYVQDTTIADNGSGATGGGINIAPTGAGGSARAVLRNVRIQNNAQDGLRIDTTTTTAAAGVSATADGSLFAGNINGIIVNGGTPPANLMVADSTVAANSGSGIVASGASTRIRVGNTRIHGNGFGVRAGTGASLLTYGDNLLDGNSPDGAFTAAAIPKK